MKFGRADMCCLILYLLIFYRLNGVLGEMNFGGLPSCGNADVDVGFALAGDLGLLAEEDHAECRAFHHAAWVEAVKRMQHRDYWTQNDVIQRIGRKS